MGTVTILKETTKNPCNFPTVILKKDDGTEVKFKKGIPRSKLIGEKFGKLTVVEYLGGCWWKCICDCGNEKIATTNHLKNNSSVSCGCMTHERKRNASIKHGYFNHRLYRLWSQAKQRCTNPKNDSYYNYGERGIKMCNEWENDFSAFYDWAMKHGYNDSLSLDRIDNEKGYSPDNCRFVTAKEQCRNRRNNRKVARLSKSGEVLEVYGSIAEAEEKMGGSIGGICAACRGKLRTSKGYMWKYAD